MDQKYAKRRLTYSNKPPNVDGMRIAQIGKQKKRNLGEFYPQILQRVGLYQRIDAGVLVIDNGFHRDAHLLSGIEAKQRVVDAAQLA